MDFSITMKGNRVDAEEFRDLVVSSGVPYGVKKGPRVHLNFSDSDPNTHVVSAVELPPKLVKKKLRDSLLHQWRSRSYEHLSVWTDDDYFDFSDMPAQLLDNLLDGFLNDPRSRIFPPLSTIPDGCRLCLENSLGLAHDVQELLKCRDMKDLGPTSFLFLTAIEEFGKALLILRAGKEAPKGYKIAVIDAKDGFRDHAEKLSIANKQLLEIAVSNNIGFMGTLSMLHTLGMGAPSLGFKSGSLGSAQREYGLYVNYVGEAKQWWSFKERWDPFANVINKDKIKESVRLLEISCDTFLKELQQKSIDQIREPKDILNRSIPHSLFYSFTEP
jgi:AbiV family abortive infection protein